jgi:hypothetical protein
MLITIKNDQLSLERHPTNGITDTPKLRNEALRRTAFLSLKFYSYKTDKGKIVLDKNKDPVTEIGDVDDEFYPLVPALLKASPAYDRLNEFAKVLAACRWAKSKGAKWENPVGKVAGTTPFGSVIVTRKSIVPAAEFDPIEGLIELHEKVRWRLSTLRLAQRGNAKVKVPQKYLEDLEDSLNNLGNDLEDRLIQSKTPEKELINAEKKINANDQLDAVRKASRCHQYEIEMSPGHVYLIDADSDDFDPCIRLELKDRVLASDGDAGGVGSVRIVFTVAEKGKYRVVLTTHADGKTGEYGLSVRQFERPSMNAIKARNDR